jgi:hypothetical protein
MINVYKVPVLLELACRDFVHIPEKKGRFLLVLRWPRGVFRVFRGHGIDNALSGVSQRRLCSARVRQYENVVASPHQSTVCEVIAAPVQ